MTRINKEGLILIIGFILMIIVIGFLINKYDILDPIIVHGYNMTRSCDNVTQEIFIPHSEFGFNFEDVKRCWY